jgi:DNA (cytosine-5)-methyltransferase 1
MKFLSVCSGIEAASVAWHPLGWESVAYSEIEPFPCKVLQHHYPDVPNLGDMTKFKEWPDADVDVFVGGTPCQSFSVAGLRKGLDDPRGNLMLTYLAIAKQYRPNWLVWENVPGVLSSADGRDFGSFLGGLAILGYGFAYRVLDAQYFGVAQRRRRVFVVGYLGDWRPAAAVLFERHSLQGHPAPSREKGKSFAASIASGAPISDYDVAGTLDKGTPGRGIGHNGNYDSQVVSMSIWSAEVSSTLDTTFGTKMGLENQHVNAGCPMFVPAQPIPIDMMNIRGRPSDDGRANRIGRGYGEVGDPMFTITQANHHGVVQPIAFSGQMSNSQTDVDMTQTLGAKNPMAVAQPVYELHSQDSRVRELGDVCTTVSATYGAGGGNVPITLMPAMAVRRLTPVECERLQGFPDRYTDIQPKGKATPDGPRYKALGNSMAVPVMAWIGKRIQEVDAICKTQQNT